MTENVANNVAQANSQDLTELWRKGELKEGAYYVCNEYDVVFTAENYINYDCFNDTKVCDFYNVETNIKEVLTPVPSYEEWRNLQNSWVDELDKATRFKKALNDVCEEYNQKLPILEAENQKLKDLLKECQIKLAAYRDLCGNYFEKNIVADSILTKIDEALKKDS